MAKKNEWIVLNDVLRDCTQRTAEKMLDSEMKMKRRKAFMLRIHSRINVLRADAERAAIIKRSL